MILWQIFMRWEGFRESRKNTKGHKERKIGQEMMEERTQGRIDGRKESNKEGCKEGNKK